MVAELVAPADRRRRGRGAESTLRRSARPERQGRRRACRAPELVSALEPADDEPEAANEVAAAGAPRARGGVGLDVEVVQLAGSCWNCGSTSSTTWYWLTCVYIVLICRWPKAS